MVIYLSRGQNDAEASIQLPAKPDTVWPIITQLDECSISAGPVKTVGAACPVPNLTQYIACADLEQEADIAHRQADLTVHKASTSTPS